MGKIDEILHTVNAGYEIVAVYRLPNTSDGMEQAFVVGKTVKGEFYCTWYYNEVGKFNYGCYDFTDFESACKNAVIRTAKELELEVETSEIRKPYSIKDNDNYYNPYDYNSLEVQKGLTRLDFCDLLIACSSTEESAKSEFDDGRRWSKLHDKIKKVLDDFDARNFTTFTERNV